MIAKLESITDSIQGQTGSLTEREESPVCVVCISDLFWDEHWSSEQQIMSRLARRCRVLYVDRPVSILSFFTGTSDASVGRQWLRWLGGGMREEGPNLTVLTPAPLLPLRYNPFVNRINSWIRRQSIKRALRKAGGDTPVLWIYAPDAGELVGTLGEGYSIYYCADDWGAGSQWWNSGRDIRAREMELAAKVDLVVGTSTNIVKRWKETHRNTLLVTNGGDVDSFKVARNPNLEIPEDLKKIPAPRIGYVGFVDARFDTSLYTRLAQARPDWNFVIVGPLMEKQVNLAQLKRLPNVHFLGPRTRGELPSYLKGFDVCTIPYICNKLAESIFPLKLFEYLAAGRPVVSTGLPELAGYVNSLHVTHTPEEFENAIEKSLTDPLPAVSESFLSQNSWEAKADSLWATIQRAIALKRHSADAKQE